MPEATILNVEASVRGRKWVLRSNEEGFEDYLIQTGLDPHTGRLLMGRNIAAKKASDYLSPKIRTFMPDPSSMQDIDVAAQTIMDAIDAKKNIAIFADYDVDGATSAAQLIRWGRALGQEFDLYVPDRILEGYGPSEQAFQILKDRGMDLVVTVDCGAAAHSALHSAQDLGLDIVVIDHHLMDVDIPPCKALVNPNRPDDTSGLGFLAAAGVTFMVLVALNRELRRRGVHDEPNIVDLLGLTALGTICDVVPLTDLNRAIVRQGLRILSKGENPGISALSDVAQIAGPYTVYHAGFVLGPRINAGGRIGQADMGALLLSTEDMQLAYKNAAELDRVNVERKRLQSEILYEANENINEEDNLVHNNVVVTAMTGWHAGIIGIVAGRLKDRLGLPVIVIGVDEDGIGKGSGRSINGVNLGGAISAAKKEGLLLSGGGHAMAGGLSIKAEKIEEFESFIQDYLRDDVKVARQSSSTKVDAIIAPSAITMELADIIENVGPYGASNPQPLFVLNDIRIDYAERLRGGHVRCRLAGQDGQYVQAICFNADDRGLSDYLLEKDGSHYHVAGRVKRDSWKGRVKLDFQIEDLALVKK
ncbi:MAG: single-stranded-DNA-specific exonuclease RecJ [Hellea sp.]|nr:single-stranded-DNA-specific exonuclease RecJ [Hellea sp.]